MRTFRITITLADPTTGRDDAASNRPTNNFTGWFEKFTIKVKAMNRNAAVDIARAMVDNHVFNRLPEQIEVTQA